MPCLLPACLSLVLRGPIDERLKHLSFSSYARVENVCRCVHGVVLGRRGHKSTAVVDTTKCLVSQSFAEGCLTRSTATTPGKKRNKKVRILYASG